MNRGKLISLEGTEGAGKSTAIHFIKHYLADQSIEAVWTREPGGTELAEAIRQWVLHPTSTEVIHQETELLLMFAARAQNLKNVILPALDAGKWVVSDRFVDASYAYQGGGRKIDTKLITMLDEWIVGTHYPDFTLLLDVTPELGFERAEKRGVDKDRIEQEQMDFFTRVRTTYLERAKRYPERIKVIDASEPLWVVENQLRAALDDIVKRR